MATIRTYVEVDVDEVLEELSVEDLLEVLKSRNVAIPAFDCSDTVRRDIEEAARAGRAFDLLLLVQSTLPMTKSPCPSTPYETLQRDPASGRPVIQ